MTFPMTTVCDVPVPQMLYGTAWKESDTARLTGMAIEQGFRGIDTANQRKHYDEAAVGAAVHAAIADGLVTREHLFLQTKFTFRPGQDHRLPYDPQAPVADQVAQSFARSLQHLQVDVIDSYVLHGPMFQRGVSDPDREAWRAMESLQQSGRVRLIGVSNVSAEQLETFCREATVRPAFVQNRCYAVRGWDRDVRQVCAKYNVTYQGFSLLTANRALLDTPLLRNLAERHECDVTSVVFRFALHQGMIALTGTTSTDHMRQDLQVTRFELSPDEIRAIDTCAG